MVKSIVTILALLLIATSGCNRGSSTSTKESTPTQGSTVDLRAPMSITLDNEGRFADGSSWTLTVNSDRSAVLETRTFPDAKKRAFMLTPKQMADFRMALQSERFFDLADEYGQLVPSGSTQTITIQSGNETKIVKLHFLMNWVHNDPARLVEPARAVRVWRHARQWFDDDDAVDRGRYDQMVLDAVANR